MYHVSPGASMQQISHPNPIEVNTLKIWTQIRKWFGWLSPPQTTPLCNNHLFGPARIDSRFAALGKRGLRCLGDLYIDGQFASFNQLCSAFGLYNTDFFRFFQLRDFAQTHSPHFPQAPPLNGIDLILQAESLPICSFLYDLLSPSNDSAVNKSRADWETELLRISISDALWRKAMESVNSSSSSARLSLIQYKVLFRLHYSRDKLFKLYPDRTTVACDRCSQTPCNLTHMYWICSKLSKLAFFFKIYL